MDVKKFGKVVVLFGGRSAEREVSLKSGSRVLEALQARGVDAHAFDPRDQELPELIAGGFDRAFIVLHGRFGEDGTIQGVLEWLGIPYTGSGVLASAIAMDKMRTKLLWEASGIPTPRWARLEATTDFAAVGAEAGPAADGQARVRGIEHRHEQGRAGGGPAAGLRAGRAVRQSHHRRAVHRGHRAHRGGARHRALPLIRLETPRAFYDYEAKYLVDSTRYILPCGSAARRRSARSSNWCCRPSRRPAAAAADVST